VRTPKITNTTGQANTLHVFVNDSENLGIVESEIKAEYPELGIYKQNQAVEINLEVRAEDDKRIQDAQNAMNHLESMGIAQMGVVIVAQVTIILLIMLYTVRERTREIGTLKAMGASNKQSWSVC
jgi:ABC-type antimicrobial peptide transport system permease subunit